MPAMFNRGRLLGGAAVVALAAAGVTAALTLFSTDAKSNNPPAAPAATPVSVAVVAQRDVALWDEFSGRLEAIENVEVRSRVAGALQAAHFREGALVKEG